MQAGRKRNKHAAGNLQKPRIDWMVDKVLLFYYDSNEAFDNFGLKGSKNDFRRMLEEFEKGRDLVAKLEEPMRQPSYSKSYLYRRL